MTLSIRLVRFKLERLGRSRNESTTHEPFGCNPTNAVGGSFILSLQAGRAGRPHGHCPGLPNPTNAVGGSFISDLALISRKNVRLDMNEPPTALVGFKKSTLRFLLVGRV